MPIIAPMRESVTMQAGNPVPVSSSEDARIAGESIAKAGAGLANLGSGLNDFFSTTNRLTRTNSIKAFSEKARTYSMTLYADVTTSDNSPDGSTMVPSFQKRYNETINEWAKEIKDEDTRQAAINAAADHMNDRLSQMIPDSMKRKLDYGYRLNEQILNDKAAWIRMNPDSFDRELQDYQLHVEAQSDALGANKEKVNELGKNAFAKSAIQGHIAKGEFDKARKILAEKLGQYLDASKGEVEKAADEITSAEWQSVTRKHTEEERQRQDAERKLKELKESNAAKLFGLTMNAKTPADREKAANLAGKLVSSRLLEKDDYNFVMSTTAKTVDVNDDRLLVAFTDRIMSGERLDAVKKDVLAAHNAGKYSSDNTMKTLSMLRQIEAHNKTDPNTTIRHRDALSRLNAYFGQEGFFTLLPEEQRKMKAVALREYTELRTHAVNPVDPETAADLIIEKYKPKIDSMPMVPGASGPEQFDVKALSAVAERIEREFKGGRISKDEMKRRLRIIEMRQKALSSGGNRK